MPQRLPLSSLLLAIGCAVTSVHAGPANYSRYATAEATPRGGDARSEAAESGAAAASLDERRAVPSFLWALGRQPPPRHAASVAEAARSHVARHASVYGLSLAALDTAEVAQVHDIGRGGIIVTLRQRIDGIDVYRSDMKVLMERDLTLVAVSGSLHPDGTPLAKPGRRSFSVPPADALALAFEDLFGVPLPSSALVSTDDEPGPASYRRFELSPTDAVKAAGLGFSSPARLRPVFFALPARLVPAYFLELYAGQLSTTTSEYYRYVIAADDGRLLYRQNLTADDAFDYRVWADEHDGRPFDGPQASFTPHPTGTPDGSEPDFVEPLLVSMEGFNTNPAGGVDPWLAASAVQTLGNNVDAYADHNAPDGYSNGDQRATTTAARAFDRSYDTVAGPLDGEDQTMSSTTQLFFVNNWLHDWFYDSGFDEAAGNAQVDNFGRGGLAGDPLHAEAQDSSGYNNANMATPADGQSPRMQMYLATAPDLERAIELLPQGTTFSSGYANFGPLRYDVTGALVMVDDGTGVATDGCEPATQDLTGQIALVDRGQCYFKLKATHAAEAGAIGIVIANNIPGDPPVSPMADADPPGPLSIPVMSTRYEEGSLAEDLLAKGSALSMRLRREPGTFRDGTIDNTISSHEWGHYLHFRLTDGYTKQVGALSEGFADFVALHMLLREGDDLDGTYAMATYAFRESSADPGYFGLRRAPYTVDFSKNALMFRHISDGEALPTHPLNPKSSPNSEVHRAGEIWATMLWEAYVALHAQAGALGNSFDQTQRLMGDLLVASMKLAPADATYTEMRDAMLAAAMAAQPAAAMVMAQAFARRGAGSCAEAPSRYSNTLTGVVEDSDLQPRVAIGALELDDSVRSCDGDGVLDGGETGQVTVEIHNPSPIPLSGAQLTVAAPAQSGAFFPSGDTRDLPVLPPFEATTAIVDIALSDTLTDVEVLELEATVTAVDACETVHQESIARRVHLDDVAAAARTDTVESSIEAWTRQGDPVAAELWSRVALGATEHAWHGIDYGGAPSDTQLVSPTLLISATEPLVVSFIHTYSFEADPADHYDGGVIELSRDGGQSWEDVADYTSLSYPVELASGVGNPLGGRPGFGGDSSAWPSFAALSLSFGTALAGETIRLRFRIGTDANGGAPGWWIDDIEMQGILNTPFSAIIPDEGTCEGLPTADAGPDRRVDGGDPVALDGSGSADPDGDPLSFSWSQIATPGPQIDLSSTTSAVASFIAPAVAEETTLTFQLQVSDGWGASSDSMRVTLVPNAGGEAAGGRGGAAPGDDDDAAAGAPSGGPDACGCRMAGRDSDPRHALWALGAGLLAYRRRRRLSRR